MEKKKVKEDLELTIKEIPESSLIKEHKITLKVDSSGSIIHRFEANGKLEMIAINSNLVRANITVTNGHLKIFSAKAFSKGRIWFPRMLTVNEINDPLNINGLVYDKFPLFGEIQIEIEGGQPEEQVELVVRWS